jgi:hypothetical protein
VGRECRVERLDCGGAGELVVVLCPPPLNPLEHPAARPEKFTSVAPGSLSMGYEEDWSRGYYVYVSPRGGGFYMEGPLDAFDDPGCGARAVPLVMEFLVGSGALGPQEAGFLEAILSRRVFRGA